MNEYEKYTMTQTVSDFSHDNRMFLRVYIVPEKFIEDIKKCGGSIKLYQVEIHLGLGFGWSAINAGHNFLWQAYRTIHRFNRTFETQIV